MLGGLWSLAYRALYAGTTVSTLTQAPLQLSPCPTAHENIAVVAADYCPQFPALYPKAHHELNLALQRLYATEDFLLQVVDALGAAVRVP